MPQRRRGNVPEIDLSTRKKPTFYEEMVLRNPPNLRQSPGQVAAAASDELDADSSPELRMAIDMAREGDDIILMPYQPTRTINPGRPRTRAIGYNAASRTMWIRFREPRPGLPGAVYEYYDVEPRHWKNIKRVKSPGQYINRQLNNYPYNRTDI